MGLGLHGVSLWAANWIGEDAINMTGYKLQWTCRAYWQRLQLFVERSLSMCESSFDLQFSLYDKPNDENAVTVKDKVSNERYLTLTHKKWEYTKLTNLLLRSFDVCLQTSVTIKTRATPSEPKKLQSDYALLKLHIDCAPLWIWKMLKLSRWVVCCMP